MWSLCYQSCWSRWPLWGRREKLKIRRNYRSGMCKVSLRMKDKAREEEWDVTAGHQQLGLTQWKTVFMIPWKPLGRKFVLKPALVVHTNPFCMMLLWIRLRDPAIVANTLIRVQKPWEHKLTIAAVTPNEWTHSACTEQHTAAEVMSLFRMNVRGYVLLCLEQHPLKIFSCEAKPTISKKSPSH